MGLMTVEINREGGRGLSPEEEFVVAHSSSDSTDLKFVVERALMSASKRDSLFAALDNAKRAALDVKGLVIGGESPLSCLLVEPDVEFTPREPKVLVDINEINGYQVASLDKIESEELSSDSYVYVETEVTDKHIIVSYAGISRTEKCFGFDMDLGVEFHIGRDS